MARTTKQGRAYAFGCYRYANRREMATQTGAFSPEVQRQLTDRHRRQAEFRAQDLIMCWNCEQGRVDDLNKCPACGEDCTPF